MFDVVIKLVMIGWDRKLVMNFNCKIFKIRSIVLDRNVKDSVVVV